jgi:hypothetical protein
MRYIPAVIAGTAYAVLVISVQTDIYQPLPPLPFAVFVALALVSPIAVGMAARTWWVLLAAAAPLVWASQGPLGLIIGGLAVAPVALGIGAGVTTGRHFGRRGALTGCVLLALAFLPLVTAVALARWPHDRQPAHPVPIDLAMGSYAGVTLGDSEQQALRRTTEPLLSRNVQDLHQLAGVDGADAFSSAYATETLVYRDHALMIRNGIVVGIVITNPNAETAQGIGPGDGLALVPQRYPMLHCEAHDSYGDEGPAGPPDCHGHVGDVGLWISEDPVQLVTIASVHAGMGLGLSR